MIYLDNDYKNDIKYKFNYPLIKYNGEEISGLFNYNAIYYDGNDENVNVLLVEANTGFYTDSIPFVKEIRKNWYKVVLNTSK